MKSSVAKKILFKLFASIFVVSFLCVKIGYAQPFSYLEPSLNYSSVYILDDSYSESWDIPFSFAVGIRTPFYLGDIEARVQGQEYTSKIPNTTDFVSLNITISHLYNVKIYEHLTYTFGIGTGIQRLTDRASGNNESELITMLRMETTLTLKPVSIFVQADYQRIFNYQRQNLIFIGLGLRKKIELPDQIIEFID